MTRPSPLAGPVAATRPATPRRPPRAPGRDDNEEAFEWSTQ